MRFIKTTHKDLKTFKNEAKNLKKQTGKKHVECLELVAQGEGYDSWKHVTQCYNQINKIDSNVKAQGLELVRNRCLELVNDFNKEFKYSQSGVVLIYDQKDTQDSDISELVEDFTFPIAKHEFFYEQTIENLEDENILGCTGSELAEIFFEDMQSMNYIFFRFKEPKKYKSFDSIIEFCREFSFWMPMGIFVDDVYHYTYHLD